MAVKDDKRIVFELACRTWPQEAENIEVLPLMSTVEATPSEAGYAIRMRAKRDGRPRGAFIAHPRALAGLNAALRTLLGEPPDRVAAYRLVERELRELQIDTVRLWGDSVALGNEIETNLMADHPTLLDAVDAARFDLEGGD